ncbi:MAG: DUF1573 domain-containing protein, partial [Lentisphaerae bacterium]|nr:DUF1573 domain-containing protein [Lentisphaerota bacterium]
MMKRLSMPCWLIVMLVCFRLSGPGWTSPVAVCEDPVFNFPPTPDTEEIMHTFELRNQGKDDLVIRRVHADCGCLLVSVPRDILPPGESMELITRFILRGRRGLQRRRVTLDTNDPLQPALTLSLIGQVLVDAAVEPERLFFGNIRPDAAVSLEALVEFHGLEDKFYAITEVTRP